MTFRVRLSLDDGTLIRSLEVKQMWEFMYKADDEGTLRVIETLCRERGVKYVSHEVTEKMVDVLVTWC